MAIRPPIVDPRVAASDRREREMEAALLADLAWLEVRVSRLDHQPARGGDPFARLARLEARVGRLERQ